MLAVPRRLSLLRPLARARAAVLPAVGLAAMLLLAGCATKPPASDPDALAEYNETNDPLEPTNRVFYAINNGLDTVILKPVAQAYRYVVPEPVRTGVHNVLVNLGTAVTLGNDILQAKPRRAGDTMMRFVINSTIGVAGIFDVADKLGYPAHDNDFGITMALWGMPEGPFLFLPILGPSDPRDFTGFGVDLAMDPFTWVGKGAATTAVKWSKTLIAAVDARERVLDAIDNIKKTALDPYATFRSLYRQHRESQISDTRNDNRATIPVWFAQPGQAAR
jgi:phospholipid-binding lipoprotein MlaA